MLALTETGCALFPAACIVPYSISSIRRETPTSFLFCWLLLLLLLLLLFSYTQGVQYIYSHPISFLCLSFARHEKRQISFASHWRNVHPHIPRRIAYVCTRQSQKRVEQNSSFHWFDLLLWFRPSAFASCPFRKRFKQKRNESEKRAVSSAACALIQSDVDDQDARSLAHSIIFNNCDALLLSFSSPPPPYFPFGFVCSRHLFETSFQPYSTRLCLAARNEVVLFVVEFSCVVCATFLNRFDQVIFQSASVSWALCWLSILDLFLFATACTRAREKQPTAVSAESWAVSTCNVVGVWRWRRNRQLCGSRVLMADKRTRISLA